MPPWGFGRFATAWSATKPRWIRSARRTGSPRGDRPRHACVGVVGGESGPDSQGRREAHPPDGGRGRAAAGFVDQRLGSGDARRARPPRAHDAGGSLDLPRRIGPPLRVRPGRQPHRRPRRQPPRVPPPGPRRSADRRHRPGRRRHPDHRRRTAARIRAARDRLVAPRLRIIRPSALPPFRLSALPPVATNSPRPASDPLNPRKPRGSHGHRELRSPAGHPRPADPQDPAARPPARLGDLRANPAGVGRRPAGPAGIALRLAPPPHPGGLDPVLLGRDRERPAGALLRAHAGRGPAAGGRDAALAPALHRGGAGPRRLDLRRRPMRGSSKLAFRLRTLLGTGRAERELTEEVEFHLEMETRKLIGQGLAPDEAAREARLRFGGVAYQQEGARDAWGVRLLRDALGDVRHAGRQFRRRPGFTFLAVITLALGIGATVALFSVVRGLLLRPLPVAREAELQVFWDDWDWRGSGVDFLQGRG